MAEDSTTLMEAAEKVWGMLDTLAAKDPEEYRRFVDEQLLQGKEQFSPPEPAYSLVCPSASHKDKECTLYVNVCKWPSVPYPKTDQDPVPVKGGTLRYLVQSNGRRTGDILYDVAFNPRVLNECSQDTVMSAMLTDLALDYVRDITGIKFRDSVSKSKKTPMGPLEDVHSSLDDHLKHLLPKECEIGDSLFDKLSQISNEETKTDQQLLPPLKLPSIDNKQTKKPLIEELSSEVASPAAVKTGRVKRPDYSLTESDGSITVKISLDQVGSASEIELDTSQSDLQLKVADKYELSLSFKRSVSEETLKATFNKSSKTLQLTAHYVP